MASNLAPILTSTLNSLLMDVFRRDTEEALAGVYEAHAPTLVVRLPTFRILPPVRRRHATRPGLDSGEDARDCESLRASLNLPAFILSAHSSVADA
jgi:hypothetical protein